MKHIAYTIAFLVLLTCSSCVQETHIKTISFEVDAGSIGNIESLSIRGNMSPLSWDRDFPLTYDKIDSVYTATIEVNTAQNQMRFKFVKNSSEFELEGKDNRTIPFEYKPENILYKSIFDSSESQISKN